MREANPRKIINVSNKQEQQQKKLSRSMLYEYISFITNQMCAAAKFPPPIECRVLI